MAKRLMFCEVCGRVTEHLVESGDDDCGEMALCTQCGRLSSCPAENGECSAQAAPPPGNTRPR